MQSICKAAMPRNDSFNFLFLDLINEEEMKKKKETGIYNSGRNRS